MAAPIRDLGAHPADGQPVGLFEGKYGPYVKHGDVSASVPKEIEPAQVTLADAVEWIAAKGGAKAGAKAGPKSKKAKAAKVAAPAPAPGRAGRRAAPDLLTAKVRKATRAGRKKIKKQRAKAAK